MRAIAGLSETEAVYATVADAYSLGGRTSFGSYDPVRGVLPITRSYVQVSGFDAIALGFNFRPEFSPATFGVAVTPEQAAAISAAAQTYSELEVRIDAAMVQGDYAPP